MGKSKQADPAVGSMAYAGIDVSAATLAVAVQREGCGGFEQKEFANSASGHTLLIQWLGRFGAQVRVSLEATGVYSLDVALALEAADGIELAVLNPKRVHQFAQTLRRSKTDKADAQALAEYSRRMEFVAWRRPSRSMLEVRAISRHLAGLTQDHTRQNNRLHAAEGSRATPACVRQDLKRSMAGLQKRIKALRKQAVALITKEQDLKRKFDRLISVPGIAETSALQLLAELAGLDPEMTVRQWVAHSGLDPAHQVSGTSVHRPSRISRHGNRFLRRALYMPALTAIRCDPHLKAFYKQLIERQKSKMQALTAVSRKILHAIFGIFKSNTPYNGAQLFPTPTAS
jgi:transposase